MQWISLTARPDPVDLDVARTAIVVVDMQNDFGSKGGMFDSAGIDITPIQAIVPRIVEVIAEARRAGMPIVFLRQQHRSDLGDAGGPDAPHFIKHQRMKIGTVAPTRDGRPRQVLVRDTWNTDNIPELTPREGDIIVGKHRFSGFFETDLDQRLKTLGVKYLIFTGATTSICVESTVRDAMFRDYVCVVLSDGTAEPIAIDAPRSNHEASLLNIELLFGWVAETADLKLALRALLHAA